MDINFYVFILNISYLTIFSVVMYVRGVGHEPEKNM